MRSRATMRAMRTEENRLLADRVQADRAAVRRLQRISIALAAVAVGLLGWIGWLLAAQRAASTAETPTRSAVRRTTWKPQVGARAADLRDSNERLRSIIDSAVDGIIVIDGKGTIEAFNRGAERLFGYPASEVLGRNVSMLMPSPDHEEHDGYLARYLETGIAKIIGIGREVTGRRRDGTTFPLHLSVGEMSINGERKFTGMLHDLSAAHAARRRVAGQRGAVAVGHRLGRGWHRRHRRARPNRGVQPGGRTPVRLPGA